jgi:hypothetical protein
MVVRDDVAEKVLDRAHQPPSEPYVCGKEVAVIVHRSSLVKMR